MWLFTLAAQLSTISGNGPHAHALRVARCPPRGPRSALGRPGGRTYFTFVTMRTQLVPAALIALLVVLHAQLWFGRGSVPNVAKLQDQLQTQKTSNQQAALFNERLAAEINDLQEGLEMVEERARAELGMVKANEIYVQIAK